MKVMFLKQFFLTFIAAAILTFFASAPSSAGVFDDGAAFTVAKTVKLGRGSASSFGDMSQIGAGSTIETIKNCDPNCISCNKSTGICSKCDATHYLYDNACQTCPQYATCNGTPNMTCPTPGYFQMDRKCYACSSAIQHCTACEGATKCTACESPYVVSDAGICEQPPTCGAAVMQVNNDVASATDAATFYSALSSGKSIILIENDMTVSASTSLGSKKLVGPKYFSDIAICASMATPTLTHAAGEKLTVSGGEIDTVNLKFLTSNTTDMAVAGYGTIKNSTITANQVKYVVQATGGKMTFSGTNTISASTASDSGTSALLNAPASTDTIEITNGTTTVNGKATYIAYVNEGKMTIASSGTFVSNANAYYGIEMYGGIFTGNGPLKVYGTAAYAIQQWGVHSSKKPSINLNANGNVLTSYYSGIYATDGSVKIAGSTTINFIANPNSSDNSSRTAFNMHEVYSNSVITLTITAPVTITGLTKSYDSQYPSSTGDSILYLVGGTLSLNSTVESKTNIGKILLNGDSMSIGSSGALLGSNFMYGYKRTVSVSAGAKMKIGGVCKKAASGGTMTTPDYNSGVTSPIAPFTSGC